ncbi:predicted protein [Thalassiosira pseudonana CCMP1335]|uniref:Endonuclease/exonuclease/phosphatase domain-containing protein n=1 Tax=Thalassiosira pseudonana TaxID=35128 RepID=B8C4H4_THAPS|nr:predicted protein [Thalassiosira pseudonana CCMP1335]EED91327.1 predicted protein [Thalassiosira pseudonana CCMP1335]
MPDVSIAPTTTMSMPSSSSLTWVDRMQMMPLPGVVAEGDGSSVSDVSSNQASYINNDGTSRLEFNIASFNILAESYLSPRSHPGLPVEYTEVAFDTEKRQQLLVDTLGRFCSPSFTSDTMCTSSVSGTTNGVANPAFSTKWDIIALQELDLVEPTDPILPALSSWGYDVVRTNTDQRRDCCAIAFDRSKFRLVRYEVVRFDDLASMYPNNTAQNESNGNSATDSNRDGVTFHNIEPNKHKNKSNSTPSELTGIVRSFLRRNCAIVAHLESNDEIKQPLIVSSAHLYWHPGYEFVKLCQAKYLLDRVYSIATNEESCDIDSRDTTEGETTSKPTVICGDMNSKPGSIVHQLFTKSSVDARAVAPWHYFWDEEKSAKYEEEKEMKNYDDDRSDGQDAVVASDAINDLPTEFGRYCGVVDSGTNVTSDATTESRISNTTDPRFTSQQSTASSAEDIDAIDDNYSKLQATLAARRLNNHISPQDYQHSTVSSPVRYMLDYTLNRFTRWLRILGIDAALETEEEERERTRGSRICVVCNGNINRVETDEKKRAVFAEHGCPDLIESKENMEVFRCDGCNQGYWWDDRPSSSASRVFTQATKLLRLCLRGGVKIKDENTNNEAKRKEALGAFDFVDVERERQSNNTNNLDRTDLSVIEWLRDEKLPNPFQLCSAYALSDGVNAKSSQQQTVTRESLPFSNVTLEFVGLLDYVFFDSCQFEQVGRLKVPTSFREMNASGKNKGHLIPSNIWPSDHLAVGARLRLKRDAIPQREEEKQTSNANTNATTLPVQMSHAPRCACGCVPNILSMMEMAALRKKAREEAMKTNEAN